MVRIKWISKKTLIICKLNQQTNQSMDTSRSQPVKCNVEIPTITIHDSDSETEMSKISLPTDVVFIKDEPATGSKKKLADVKPIKQGKPKNVRNSEDNAVLQGLTADMFVREVPSFVVPFVYEKPPMQANSTQKASSATSLPPRPSENFFGSAVGKFLMDIGDSIVCESIQKDLLRQEKCKLRSASDVQKHLIETNIENLETYVKASKDKNSNYKLQMKSCEFCSFKTESALVLSHHYETPHIFGEKFKCNFCKFSRRMPHSISNHMMEKHNVLARIERPLSNHQCPNCPYEANGTAKLLRHLPNCAKRFSLATNLAPPSDWDPPAVLIGPKPKNGLVSTAENYQKMLNSVANFPGKVSHNGSQWAASPLTLSNSGFDAHNLPTSSSAVGVSRPKLSNSQFQLPRNCELCAVTFKSLVHFRRHMSRQHSVSIHPKCLRTLPPLTCFKCPQRFFSDRGLEIHLLCIHAMITNSIQTAASAGTDSGRCLLCGVQLQSAILGHVQAVHRLDLKPAEIIYKCPKCGEGAEKYEDFMKHAKLKHRNVASRKRSNKVKNLAQVAKNHDDPGGVS